jgi:hypothetical protein
MEAALTDAETKVKFYDGEQRRCAAEADRWREVANSLKSVISLTTQPLAMVKRTNGNANGNGNGNGIHVAPDEKVPTGFWEEQYRKILAGGPMGRKDVITKLAEMSGRDRNQISSTIAYGVKHGKIIQIDGNLCLPDWTDPAKAS